MYPGPAAGTYNSTKESDMVAKKQGSVDEVAYVKGVMARAKRELGAGATNAEAAAYAAKKKWVHPDNAEVKKYAGGKLGQAGHSTPDVPKPAEAKKSAGYAGRTGQHRAADTPKRTEYAGRTGQHRGTMTDVKKTTLGQKAAEQRKATADRVAKQREAAKKKSIKKYQSRRRKKS
jgi:hypothetical protein